MGKYTVNANQNLYDVAIRLYGSIEGIIDLLMLNEGLSMSTELKYGDVLEYTENLYYNETVTRYFQNNKIIPSNGTLKVNKKSCTDPLMAMMFIDSETMQVSFFMSGSGTMYIDWGDNTDIQKFQVVSGYQVILHQFNNILSSTESRIIKIYGSFELQKLDLSGTYAKAIYFLEPIHVEEYMNTFSKSNLDYIELLNGAYKIDISDWNTSSLLPLLKNTELMTLNLSSSTSSSRIIDEYLIELVRNYGTRRSCTVTLTTQPSGIYQEPAKDANLEYILTSGMEAIWVLTHEEAWNEGGLWTFNINNTTYKMQ